MSKQQYPPQVYLRQCFRYENGKLFWAERPRHHFNKDGSYKTFNKRFAGKEAGCLEQDNKGGTWKISISGVTYYRHRLVWVIHHGDATLPTYVTHDNGCDTDDRIENLVIKEPPCKQIRRKKRVEYYANNRDREKARMRLWREANPERHAAASWRSHLMRNYQITVEQHREMSNAQGGLCAGCATKPKGRLNIDHSHLDGKVRGLLCGNCNRAVGLINDSSDTAMRLVQYLRKYGT